MPRENELHIYTDGSSLSKPRRGGLGARFIYIPPDGVDEKTEDFAFQGYKDGNSQEMELKACIEALKRALKHGFFHSWNKIVIHTDSMYVKEYHELAMFRWPKTHWTKANEDPVSHASLWKEFVRVRKKIRKRVEFKWVKGHSKNTHNEAADELAKRSARTKSIDQLTYPQVRKKLSPNTTKVGSVKMEGQRVTIRIVTGRVPSSAEILQVQI